VVVDVVASSKHHDPATKWAKPGDVGDCAFFHFPWGGVVERGVGQMVVDVDVVDGCKAPELRWEVGRQKPARMPLPRELTMVSAMPF
jgi:hypothetical protein